MASCCVGIARKMALLAALSAAISTTAAVVLLSEGNALATSESATEEEEIEKERDNHDDDRHHLSLIWNDGDPFPNNYYYFPQPTKTNKEIRRIHKRRRQKGNPLWSRFFGNHHHEDDTAIEPTFSSMREEEYYREDVEKIRAILRKFYRLADPKFARASLAKIAHTHHLPGSTTTEDTDTNDETSLEKNEDDLVPGTVLSFLLEDYAYELVDRMQLELGATPKHYMDFAYRSVTTSQTRDDKISPKTERRSSDDLLTSVAFEDEDGPSTCAAVITTKESRSVDAGSSSAENQDNKDDTTDKDRAMAFFTAWWKWWLPFANSQWWKNQGSSKADYDIGKSPFAGGSNGEVWRGRRICHPNRKYKRETDAGDGSNHAFFNSHRKSEDTERKSHDDDIDDSENDWERDAFSEERQEDRFTREDCDDQTPLVLKRLRVERGYQLLEAGLREVYFGKLIARVLEDTKKDMYTVYIDHFFREVPRRQPARTFGGLSTNKMDPNHQQYRANDLELWIVYEDAGPSLRSYIYSPIISEGGFVMHQQSKLWTKLRTFTGEDDTKAHRDDGSDDEDWESLLEDTFDSGPTQTPVSTSSTEKQNRGEKIGRSFMQNILREVLSAASELHKRGIVHRDIKPSNVMCRSDLPLSVDLFDTTEDTLPTIVCKLGDFSSGWDRYTSENLYTKGPTPGEQTDEYAPPESYVGPYWKPFDEERPQTYDSWSIGVLALELLLGTPNVFSVDQRTNALLTNKLKRARASEDEIAYALYLAALSNFCIFVPSNETIRGESWPLRYGDPLHKTAMVKESCTLQDFHHALRARDPLGIGFDASTDLLLHLILQLLAFDPSERMTAEEALNHPYFLSPDGTLESLNEIPSYDHDALISEMIDARIDFDVEDDTKTFQCPVCGREFHDWRSCHQHANHRKHAKFCDYNHTVLPSCINTHSMLPEHPTSGYCDLQGRRKTIEDFHSIHLHHGHQFYAIFDGHTGNLASKFAASELYTELRHQLPELMQTEGGGTAPDKTKPSWKEEIKTNVTNAFERVHERFLDRITTMTSSISKVGSAPQMDQSGTTATAIIVTEDVLIAAVLGDSRGVLASGMKQAASAVEEGGLKKNTRKSQYKNFPKVSPIQFSIDHVASDPAERELVRKRGGYVSHSGGVSRVNGTLAITRSIGDANLAPVLSREPRVRSFDRSELRELCGELGKDRSNDQGTVIPCFAILASDGLWDVVSNQEAVDMVVDVILKHNEAHNREVALSSSHNDDIDNEEENGGPFQESAERLAVEAYVRGSTDNIGVCVIAID